MNILYISPRDPRLFNDGNEQRTNLLWRALKKIGNVYTIVYINENNSKIESISDDGSMYAVSTNVGNYNRSLKGFLYPLLAKFCGFAYLPFKFPTNVDIFKIFKDVKIDIVVSRYSRYPAKYHYWEKVPTYVDIDDYPIQLYETRFKYHIPCFFRPLSRYMLAKQFNSFLKRISGGWISNKEQLLCLKKISYLPNIPFLPSENYNVCQNERKYLFTVGAMSYEPNYRGVDKFLSEIWPTFHEKYPEVQYVIGGKGAPQEYASVWKSYEGVSYVGFVDDLEKAYEFCYASVVPIYTGAGTCIKVLESMAYSRTCLSTKFGARGMNAVKKNDGLIVFTNADDFIKAFERINNSYERRVLESEARGFISQNYSEDKFIKAVIDEIQ